MTREGGLYRARVVPGVYDLRYGQDRYLNNAEAANSWPVNEDHILVVDLAIEVSSDLEIDIETQVLALTMTLDDASLSAENTDVGVEDGRITLLDAATGEEVFSYTGSSQVARDGGLYRARVVKGIYNLRYGQDRYLNNAEANNSWPVNEDARWSCVEVE